MKAAGVFILLVAVAISSGMADNGALRQSRPPHKPEFRGKDWRLWSIEVIQ